MSSFALRLPSSETYLRATNTNKASSVASMHPVLAGCSVVMSDHGQVRQIHVTPVTEATLTPLLLIKIHDILSRASDGWLVLTGSTVPLSLEALRDVVCRGFGSRLLAVTCQWKSGIPAETTGLVTCGPHSLGATQWRIATVFAPEHHVPLTLSVLQLASRFWYATLPGGWPRSLSWRMLQRSVESRRILETVLVFHAMGGASTREFWASVAAVSSSKLVAPLGEVSFGAYGGQLLSDLATWGNGVARWSVHRVSELEAVGVLAAGTVGHVLHAAALPIASRGFQHLGPSKREELLGAHVSSILDNIAVSPRAAQERIRTTVSPLPQAETSSDDNHADALLSAIAWPDFALLGVRDVAADVESLIVDDLATPEHRCTTQPASPQPSVSWSLPSMLPILPQPLERPLNTVGDTCGAYWVPTPSTSQQESPEHRCATSEPWVSPLPELRTPQP